MSERARDYVARYMAERYTPEELAKINKETSDWLLSLPEPDPNTY